MANATLRSDHAFIIQGNLKSTDPSAFKLVRQEDADIPLKIQDVHLMPGKSSQYVVRTVEILDPNGHYIFTARGDELVWSLAPSLIHVVLTVIMAAALINNFVFTRYLGLCVFFGVSRRKETAIGMGITFTVVGVLSGLLSWAVQNMVLSPLKLNFLQIVVFIGIVACLVQATDSVLKKIRPVLHRKFGIYLVLITTNCIILAVPLLNATAHASFWESMGLAIGSGLGFALALFLMSGVREKVELAPVPAIFKGLPIAFIIAGLFALSFLGFSGLKF